MSRRDPRKDFQKLEALFLNKIKGLDWFYFLLNLDETGPTRNEVQRFSADQNEWLDKISGAHGTFTYDTRDNLTDDERYKLILNNLITFLRTSANAPRGILRRIFDENEPSILNQSKADEGRMGKYNRENSAARKKLFDQRIRSQPFKEKGKSILAEGDSWFQHPPVRILKDTISIGDSVKDIIDWLNRENPNYAIYSMAAGGDWLSNMIRTTDYISMLDRLSPDAFLFSGGGNDMMGGFRVAKLIRKRLRSGALVETNEYQAFIPKRDLLIKERSKTNPDKLSFDFQKYERGIQLLDVEFFNFLNLTMSQYYLLLTELQEAGKTEPQGEGRFDHIKFITQGYDFVIPSPRKAPIWRFRNRKLNTGMNSGRWLHDPMVMKGFFDPQDQEAIAYAMVWEFNEMMIQLSEHFPQLYHIDCRGTAQSEDDWFDEIHLKSHAFKRIAATFRKCIESEDTQKKVYRVVDEAPA